MALKDSIDRLKAQLLISQLQQKNPALYQVINQLIAINSELAAALQAVTGDGSGDITTGQSILTLQNEQATLPNSRRIMPQSGVTVMTNGEQTWLGSSIIPMMLEGEIEGIEGAQGPPGLQGVRGPAGSPAAAPYYWNEEDDGLEAPPLLTLDNGVQYIPGTWTFGSGRINVESSSIPQLVLKDTSAGTDLKYWRIVAAGGNLLLQSLNDAFSTSYNHQFWVQNAGVPLYTNLRAGLVMTAYNAISLTADATAWNPTGLGGGGFHFAVTATVGGWTIRGITAQTHGTIIVIFNISNTTTFTLAHEDAAASAANRLNLPSAINYLMAQYQAAMLMYDSNLSRWIALSIT